MRVAGEGFHEKSFVLTKSFSVRLRALPSLRDLSGHAVIEFAQIHPLRSQSDKLRAPAEKRGFPCAFYYFYFSRKIFCADKIFFRELRALPSLRNIRGYVVAERYYSLNSNSTWPTITTSLSCTPLFFNALITPLSLRIF